MSCESQIYTDHQPMRTLSRPQRPDERNQLGTKKKSTRSEGQRKGKIDTHSEQKGVSHGRNATNTHRRTSKASEIGVGKGSSYTRPSPKNRSMHLLRGKKPIRVYRWRHRLITTSRNRDGDEFVGDFLSVCFPVSFSPPSFILSLVFRFLSPLMEVVRRSSVGDQLCGVRQGGTLSTSLHRQLLQTRLFPLLQRPQITAEEVTETRCLSKELDKAVLFLRFRSTCCTIIILSFRIEKVTTN